MPLVQMAGPALGPNGYPLPTLFLDQPATPVRTDLVRAPGALARVTKENEQIAQRQELEQQSAAAGAALAADRRRKLIWIGGGVAFALLVGVLLVRGRS